MMTYDELAGHGHLAAVTHGTTVDGERVVVLYVEAEAPGRRAEIAS